jgi:hypothetical protein
MSLYLDFRRESLVEIMHRTVVSNTTVSCDYIYCDYEEEFDTMEEAEVAAEIHEEQD